MNRASLTSSETGASTASIHTPSSTSQPSSSPSPQPPPSPRRQSPFPSSPRGPSFSPRASRSSPSDSVGGTSREAVSTPSSSPISARDTIQNETRSPRGRSPSLGVDVSRLSLGNDAEAPQSTRGQSPSLSVDISGLSLGDDPEELTPYDINSEQMPPHRFFSTEFQATLREGVGIAKKAVTILDRLTGVVGHDETLIRLREDAQRLSSFRPADMKTIAVLGDSGEGKSSLINSLLGFPGLAKTGDIGSACTSVVTEYHQKKDSHSAPITIEVECMTQPEIEEVLSELVWSYRQLYLPSIESANTSEADYARYTRESVQAWSALEAAFGHRREFREEQLRDMSEGAQERLKARLVEWSRELEWPEGVQDGRWASTAGSAEECCGKTQLFMMDRHWPFTKVIRIYLDAQVLQTGVVLADLPGLQDTNLARVRATQDYLMRCDNIFIVAKISRAVTDQSLRSSLFSVFSRHVPQEWEESAARSLSIAVVCTKSDDIDLHAARREFCGPGKRIASSDIAELDEGIEAAKAGRNRPLKKKLKLRRDLAFINARNQHVTEGLQAAYASKAPGRNLEVFCVSNRLYEKYSRKGNAEIVRESAIPAVRRFCHAVSADAQLREGRHYLRSSLFSLVNSLHIWSCSAVRDREEVMTSEETKRVLRRALDDADSELAEAISQFQGDFDECFQEQIQTLPPKREPEWERAAASEAREWRNWHFSQYKAWCANNGNHCTPKRGPQDWNAKIIWKMRSELAYQWDIVEEDIPELFRALSSEAKEILKDLKRRILGLCDDGSRGMITDAIKSGRRQFAYQCNLSEQRFTQEFRLVRRYASESSHNSYILGEMLPAYRAAKSEFGTGMLARQQAIIEGRINDGALFPNIIIAITGQVGILVEEAQRELREATRRVIAQIRMDAALVLVSSRPPQQEARSSESVRRLEDLAKAVERLKEDICRIGNVLETNS